MKKSDLNVLPKSIRKKYNLTNVVRTVTLFLGWMIALLLFIYSLGSGQKGFSNIIFAPIFSGGFIHGLFHAEFVFKNVFKKLGLIIGFFVSGVIFTIAAYSGFIFIIIDTVLFIKKKPLIYPFEDKHFLVVEDLAELIRQEGGVAYEYDLPEDFN